MVSEFCVSDGLLFEIYAGRLKMNLFFDDLRYDV